MPTPSPMSYNDVEQINVHRIILRLIRSQIENEFQTLMCGHPLLGYIVVCVPLFISIGRFCSFFTQTKGKGRGGMLSPTKICSGTDSSQLLLSEK